MRVQSITLQERAIKKVMWRLLPLTMLLFFFSLLDRTNISFAALQMNKDLALSPSQYGAAASIFFIGYFLFEIPSNILLERVGARVWLARIMITWGLVVACMAYVEGARSLYTLRFLLGIAEAGLLPGLLYYLSYWLPAHQRGVAYSILLMTTTLAYAVGAPFTTALMQVKLFGFQGWQTMFLIQGVLTIIVGIATIFVLPTRIRDANWLSGDEKDALTNCLDEEMATKRAVGATRRWEGFFDPRVLISVVMSFFLVCANFGTVLWLPQILKGIFPTLTNIKISLLVSLAFAIGGVAGLLAGRNSDRTGDRKRHLVVSSLIGAIGFAIAAHGSTPLMSFVGICIGVLGIWSMFGVYWAYNGDILGGSAAAAGLALINSVGALGGLTAPLVLAWALKKSGSYSGSLSALAVFSLLTMLSALCLRTKRRAAAEPVVGIAE